MENYRVEIITGEESLTDLLDNPETTKEEFEQWQKKREKNLQKHKNVLTNKP